MKAEQEFTASTTKAEHAYEAAKARAAARRDAALSTAAEKLARAVAEHDKVTAAADRAAAQAVQVATRDRDEALAKAVETFDRQAAREIGAMAGARVTGTPGGSWFLHDGRSRQPVASVSPSHNATWRCQDDTGSVTFVPTEPAARAWLWRQAALDQVA
jgi:hypothetical protein